MKRIKAFFARLPIFFCGPAIIYPILFFAALVFAQMHKTVASHVLFVFVAALPIASALYLLMARLCIRATLRLPKRTVKKQPHLSVIADISSKIPVVFPFTEAVILLPDESGIGLEHSRFVTSVLPFQACTVSRSAFFALCGEYEICLSHLYVYDLTRSVRIRININKRESVLVLPRNINLGHTASLSGEDVVSINEGERTNFGQAEPIDVREYIPGDSLRRVHWKLSSKSDELFVREYSDGGRAMSFVFCDLEGGYKSVAVSDTERLILCNAVIECAVAALHRAIDEKNTVCLSYVWDGAPMSVLLESHADVYGIYRHFLSAKPSRVQEQVKLLLSAVHIPKNAAVTIVTSRFDTADADAYTPMLESDRAEVIVCTPKEFFSENAEDTAATASEEGIAVHQIVI